MVLIVALFGFYSCDSTDDVDDKTDIYTLVVRPIELTFDDSGGELLIEVNTEYPDLVVTTDLDWLSAFEVPGTTNWKLIALQNMEYEACEGKVIVKAGILVEEVTVIQRKRDVFILPLLAGDRKREGVKAFEESRNSTLKYEYDDYLVYTLDNEIWHEVEYYWHRSVSVEEYIGAMIVAKKENIDVEASDVDDFLSRHNFTKVSAAHYSHNQLDYDLLVAQDNEEVALGLFDLPSQSKAYPTWDGLPFYPQIEHLPNGDGKQWYFEDVQAYEAGLDDGAVFIDSDMPYSAIYEVNDGQFTYSRHYYFDANYTERFNNFRYNTNDFDKVTFEHGGRYYLTDEMFEMLAAKGYRLAYIDVYANNYEFVVDDTKKNLTIYLFDLNEESYADHKRITFSVVNGSASC